ncbi:MAG: hypothetical protein WDN46_11450 [Methylocella sp.]
MRFNSCQRLLAAALATASCLIGITALDAQQRPRSVIARDHDGVYAVHVVTLQGMCDKDYHWTITVADGRVTSPADGFMQASGEISARGIVSLAFRRDNQIANVAGKLKGKTGSGSWSSPTMQCVGSWSAERQG